MNTQFTLVPSIRSKYWKDLPIGSRVRVAGTLTSYVRETSPKGEFSRFSGKFVCAVEGSDKPISSVILMLPKFGDNLLKASLDDAFAHGAEAVEFGLEMSKVADEDSATKYVWEIKSLMDPIVPTERFNAMLDFGSAPAGLLSGPKDQPSGKPSNEGVPRHGKK